MATGLKSFSLAGALVAGVAVLAGATLCGSSGHAQEDGRDLPDRPDTPDAEDTSAPLTEKALIDRGNKLLEAGDFASARLLYQAAARRGSGKAAMLTGVTFDPRYRELAGVSGPWANAELARQWYAVAIEMGDDQARRNDRDLVQWLKQRNADTGEAASTEKQPTAPQDQSAPIAVARPVAEPVEKAAQQTPDPEPHPETAGEAMSDPAPELKGAPTAADPSRSTFDASIARAHLTSAVRDREPVDRLPSTIEISGSSVDRIVFFSEVRGLAGHEVSHRWEREGKTMADVSFAVGGDTWRMHSSKRVTADMIGAWRVAVIDNGGAELASVPFVLE